MINDLINEKNQNILIHNIRTVIKGSHKNWKCSFPSDLPDKRKRRWEIIRWFWIILNILFWFVAVPCLVIILPYVWWDTHSISLWNYSNPSTENDQYVVWIKITGAKFSSTDLNSLKFNLKYSYEWDEGFWGGWQTSSGQYSIINSNLISSKYLGGNYEYIIKLTIPYSQYENLQSLINNNDNVWLSIYVNLENFKPLILNITTL